MTHRQIISAFLYGFCALWVIYDGVHTINTRKAHTRYGKDIDGKKAVALGRTRLIAGILWLAVVLATFFTSLN